MLDILCSSIWFSFVFVGIVGYVVGIIYGLYDMTKKVNELHHIQPSNCTILDAVFAPATGDTSAQWDIHVNFTIPPAFHPPANATHVSLLDGTNSKAHYAVNETYPCYVSTRNLDTVSLSRKAADGGTIFGIFMLCVLAIPILVGVVFGLLVVTRVLMQGFGSVFEWGVRFVKGAWKRADRFSSYLTTGKSRTAHASLPETIDLEGRAAVVDTSTAAPSLSGVSHAPSTTAASISEVHNGADTETPPTVTPSLSEVHDHPSASVTDTPPTAAPSDPSPEGVQPA